MSSQHGQKENPLPKELRLCHWKSSWVLLINKQKFFLIFIMLVCQGSFGLTDELGRTWNNG